MVHLLRYGPLFCLVFTGLFVVNLVVAIFTVFSPPPPPLFLSSSPLLSSLPSHLSTSPLLCSERVKVPYLLVSLSPLRLHHYIPSPMMSLGKANSDFTRHGAPPPSLQPSLIRPMYRGNRDCFTTKPIILAC
ncbi:hypothetical protein Bca4012_089034 [Brassica carinata]